MKLQPMNRRLVLFFGLMCMLLTATFAQQNHFMYIQSDTKDPFSVALNGKIYNSSASGYLIIPQLPDGENTLKLSFTKGKYPDQVFVCKMEGLDVGYALKNMGDKGWGLLNLQTMAVVPGAASAAAKPPKKGAKPADTPPANQPVATTPDTPTATTPKNGANPFGDMLSQVVNDPTLKNAPVVSAPPKKAPEKKEQVVAKNTPKEPVVAETKDPVAEEEIPTTKGIIKADEKERNEGTDYVFIDFNAKGADTIKIFIPVGSAEAPVATTEQAAPEKPKDADKPKENKETTQPKFVDVKSETPADDKKVDNPFFNKPAEASKETVVVAPPVTTAQPPANTNTETSTTNNSNSSTKIAGYNSNCSQMAEDKDLDRLKKRMVGAGEDEKMIEVARKAFKSKCYTTSQIKTLGMLFYTDASRYSFYDAAYPFVYDVTNYATLENMLIDDYYKKRFRAMLRL